MFEKIIKYIIYLLSTLIVIALFGVIYGMYTKIASKSSKNVNLSEKVFLSLENDQVIKNMQVIDKSKILITIYNGKDIEGIIFDIENKKIIQTINK